VWFRRRPSRPVGKSLAREPGERDVGDVAPPVVEDQRMPTSRKRVEIGGCRGL
jgi:hypothetical protein